MGANSTARAEPRASNARFRSESGSIQWIALVGQALRELSNYPLMVLALGRPETTELFPELWSPRLQTLPLHPLGAVAMRKLVHQVLGGAIETDKVARIVELAGGNALYLEELIS